MARHEYKAFVHGEMYEVEDHGNYITIRGDGGCKILSVHRDTAAELVTILEHFGMTALKNNDLIVEEVERMELEYNELKEIIKRNAREFVDGKSFETLSETEKATMKQLMAAFSVRLALDITNAEMDKLDMMAEEEVE